MRSDKRYTNTTFTKRVDHTDGHRSDRHPNEPAVCRECHALYLRGHWLAAEHAPSRRFVQGDEMRETTCPACMQIMYGEPSGFVFIDGDYFVHHRNEIENHLNNENKRTAEVNPMARIMELREAKDSLVVTTTTEHLAQQLGRSMGHAFGGDVRYDFSHENKLARVYWHRD